MITSKFVELFRFFIKNDLYPNQLYEDAKPLPRADYSFLLEPATISWMKTRGLIFKPGINEFSIYTESIQLNGAGHKVRYTLNDHKLVLGVLCANTSLLWPAKASGEIFFMSNLGNDNLATPNNLHLTIAPDKLTQADILEAFYASFQYVWNGQASVGNTYLLSAGSDHKITPAEIIKQNSSTLLKFNIETLPAGKYDLFINGNFKKSFFALGAFKTEPLFGAIEVLLGNPVLENYRLTNDIGVISRRDYLVTV